VRLKRNQFSKRWVFSLLGIALLAASACNSGPSTAKAQNEKTAVAPQNPPPMIDLNCIIDRLRNPTEAFHYSYSRNGQSASITEEADVTPTTLDGTINSVRDGQKNPSQSVHASRSDNGGWQREIGNLSMGFGMPASLMMANKMSSELVREGTENVNGYDAVKYSVDTARLDATDRALLGTTFEKGTVWVVGPGCPVKIVMDTEAKDSDGTVRKDHYEEALTKK